MIGSSNITDTAATKSAVISQHPEGESSKAIQIEIDVAA
jgi:hypothetical protein